MEKSINLENFESFISQHFKISIGFFALGLFLGFYTQ